MAGGGPEKNLAVQGSFDRDAFRGPVSFSMRGGLGDGGRPPVAFLGPSGPQDGTG